MLRKRGWRIRNAKPLKLIDWQHVFLNKNCICFVCIKGRRRKGKFQKSKNAMGWMSCPYGNILSYAIWHRAWDIKEQICVRCLYNSQVRIAYLLRIMSTPNATTMTHIAISEVNIHSYLCRICHAVFNESWCDEVQHVAYYHWSCCQQGQALHLTQQDKSTT